MGSLLSVCFKGEDYSIPAQGKAQARRGTLRQQLVDKTNANVDGRRTSVAPAMSATPETHNVDSTTRRSSIAPHVPTVKDSRKMSHQAGGGNRHSRH